MSYLMGFFLLSLFCCISYIILGWRDFTPEEWERRNEEELEWQRRYYKD